jgi:ribosomal protein S18
MLANQWDMRDGRLRSRATAKHMNKSRNRTKVKCNVCNKFYRVDYMKVRFLPNTISMNIMIMLSVVIERRLTKS